MPHVLFTLSFRLCNITHQVCMLQVTDTARQFLFAPLAAGGRWAFLDFSTAQQTTRAHRGRKLLPVKTPTGARNKIKQRPSSTDNRQTARKLSPVYMTTSILKSVPRVSQLSMHKKNPPQKEKRAHKVRFSLFVRCRHASGLILFATTVDAGSGEN